MGVTVDWACQERKRKVDTQRRSLSLAGLFAKPRPIWSTPALVGSFGDTYIEGTGFESKIGLAWSFIVINHAMQQMLRNQDAFLSGLGKEARGALSDTMHILSRSALAFKQMARLLRTPNTTQLMAFLRRIRKLLQKIETGESLLLPAIV